MKRSGKKWKEVKTHSWVERKWRKSEYLIQVKVNKSEKIFRLEWKIKVKRMWKPTSCLTVKQGNSDANTDDASSEGVSETSTPKRGQWWYWIARHHAELGSSSASREQACSPLLSSRRGRRFLWRGRWALLERSDFSSLTVLVLATEKVKDNVSSPSSSVKKMKSRRSRPETFRWKGQQPR